jgi:exosortase
MNSKRNLVVTFWSLLILACLPLLWKHVTRLWNYEQYHYLPALALASAFLIYGRWDRQVRRPASIVAWGLLTIGILLLGLAILSASGWLGAAAFIACMGSWLASVSEKDGRSLLTIWPLFWLILSLPLGFDSTLTSWLQLQSSRLSSFALDLSGVPHVLFGNVIELTTGRLFVEQACSGVQSLFTLLFVAVLIVVWLRRSVLLLPIYVLVAVFWAGVMNVFRIYAIAYVQHFYNVDLAHGWRHALLGYFCLGLAVILLLSSDRLLRILFFPIETKEAGAENNPWVFSWNRCVNNNVLPKANLHSTEPESIATTGPLVYALLAVPTLLCLGAWGQLSATVLAKPPAANVAKGEPFIRFPEDLQSLGLVGFEQQSHEIVRGDIDLPYGENADIWRGVYQGIPVAIAVNQPYPDWHDLCLCYQGTGLQLNDRKTIVGKDDWNRVEARLVNEIGQVKYVWFSAFDNNGAPVQAPQEGVIGRWLTRLSSSDSMLTTTPQGDEVAIVQLLVESDEFLLPDVLKQLGDFHQAFRELALAMPSSMNSN